MTKINPEKWARTFFLYLPVVVMLAAYGAIAAFTGNLLPWLEIVHESGERTLVGSVLYYQHAARELPLDVVLGLAMGGCALWALPRAPPTNRRRQGLLVLGAALAIAVIVAGTLWSGGSALLWDNLLQMYTRPGQPLDYGSHWRYHLLSRLLLMLVSFGLAGLLVLGLRGKQGTGDPGGQRVFLGALGLFFALTLVFAPDIDPFVDPVFLGHQVREVFTHMLVTVPFTWWVCLALSGNYGQGTNNVSISLRWPLVAGIGGVLIGLYLLTGALLTSAVSQGQTDSVVQLIAPHFFEHSFSYVVVPLVAGLVYEWKR